MNQPKNRDHSPDHFHPEAAPQRGSSSRAVIHRLPLLDDDPVKIEAQLRVEETLNAIAVCRALYLPVLVFLHSHDAGLVPQMIATVDGLRKELITRLDRLSSGQL